MDKKRKDVSQSKDKVEVDLVSSDDESPSWYHYLTILLIIFGGIWLLSFIVNTYTSYSDVEIIDAVNSTETYSYKKTIGNITYNIQLSMPLIELEKFNFIVEPDKLDILNTLSYTFSFNTYNGTDNGQVTLSATKLRRYLSLVHFAKFDEGDFAQSDVISCMNSTVNRRVVLFEIDPSIEVSSVLEDTNGCIRFVVNDAFEMPHLTDYFIVSLLNDE
jgi:hypothetical protein